MINKWLIIIIILCVCFIFIPIILKLFKINEGFFDPLVNPNGDIIPPENLNSQINSNIREIYDAEIDLSNNLYDIYNINLDLSNNAYRKNDAKKDISNNLYDTSGNSLLNSILSKLTGLTTKLDSCNIDKTETIDCIADFGTNIGDELCCDQPGILTDTKYVCPSNYPKCGSMECGTQYGKCSKA
jgi:hypothetical protein